MSSITTIVQSTTRDFTPAELRLPATAWSVFTALNQLHGLWRWYRRYELYSNPNNFAQLLAGHAVNFMIGDNTLLRIAAQCVLIATRILECIEQQAALFREGGLWLEAVKGRYPQPLANKWSKGEEHWVSPSTVIWWKASTQNVFFRIKRIVCRTMNIMTKTVKLSMKIMDAIDSFTLSPETRNEGINEFFVNAMKWLDTIVERKEKLLQGMLDNREIIERILHGSPFTYEQLLNTVENTLNKTETIYDKAQKVSQFGNGIIVDFGKRALNAGMVVTGFSKLRPTALI